MSGGTECHAISSHTPDNEGQIEIKAGDTVTSVTHLGNGWSIGRNLTRGTVGVFPTNCVSFQLTPPNRTKSDLTDCIANIVSKIPKPNEGSTGKKSMNSSLDEDDVPLPPPPEFQSDYETDDNLTDGANSQNSTLTRGARALYANVAPFRSRSVGDKLGAPSTKYQAVPLSGSDIDSDIFEYDAACMPRKPIYRKKPQIAVKPSAAKNMFPQLRDRNKRLSVSSQSDLDLTLERRNRTNRYSCPVDVHISATMEEKDEKGSNVTLSEPLYTQVCRSVPSLNNLKSGKCHSEGDISPHASCSYSDIADGSNCTGNSSQSTQKVGPSDTIKRALNTDWLENKQNEQRSQNKAAQQRRDKKSNIKKKSGKTDPSLFVELSCNDQQQGGASTFIGATTCAQTIANDHTMLQEIDGGCENGQPNGRYQDYRTLQCPSPDVCGSETCNGAGISSNTSRTGPNRPNPPIPAPPLPPHIAPPAVTRTSAGLILAILTAFLIGLLIFLWMRYSLHYDILVSISVAGGVSLILCILFAASRICRCVAALMVPSLATTKGRITFLFLISGFLLGGPITNIYHNLVIASQTMSCSSEQVYNQSMLLVHPFHNMISRLNETSQQLHSAAKNVTISLVPLHGGLDNMENGMKQAQEELKNTKQVCQSLLNNAYQECLLGIKDAAGHCSDVMVALKNIYKQAKEILDKINPENFGATPPSIHRYRYRITRQAVYNRDRLANGLRTNWDLCKPLNHTRVCLDLNKTDRLCRPSGSAGLIIREAINKTRTAMSSLRKTLRFHIPPSIYLQGPTNTSQSNMRMYKHSLDAFTTYTQYFDLTISILRKIIPGIIFILVAVSYMYLKHYIAKDEFDNLYITPQFKSLDRKRVENGNSGLLPLKKYERKQLIDTTTTEISPLEEGLYKIGLCVLFLHLILSLLCYLFDFVLYWILNQIKLQGSYANEVTSIQHHRASQSEHLMANVLESFLNSFQFSMVKYALDAKRCLPEPEQPSIWFLLVIFFMYAFLIMTVLLKSYLLRCRRGVAARFYSERERVRTMQLYYKLLHRRSRLYEIETLQAKKKYREKVALQKMGIQGKTVSTLPPFKLFMYKQCRCFICGCPEEQNFYECSTDECPGVYCAECFKTVGRKCPLCTPNVEHNYQDMREGDESSTLSEGGLSQFYV